MIDCAFPPNLRDAAAAAAPAPPSPPLPLSPAPSPPSSSAQSLWQLDQNLSGLERASSSTVARRRRPLRVVVDR